jgi:hypothetical protein
MLDASMALRLSNQSCLRSLLRESRGDYGDYLRNRRIRLMVHKGSETPHDERYERVRLELYLGRKDQRRTDSRVTRSPLKCSWGHVP